jgi:hypothetical protein
MLASMIPAVVVCLGIVFLIYLFINLCKESREKHRSAACIEQLLDRKTRLLRLFQEIPLREAEQAAVEDGV